MTSGSNGLLGHHWAVVCSEAPSKLAPQELGVVITLNGPVELVRLRVDRTRPSRFLASNFQLGSVFELLRGQAITATAGISWCPTSRRTPISAPSPSPLVMLDRSLSSESPGDACSHPPQSGQTALPGKSNPHLPVPPSFLVKILPPVPLPPSLLTLFIVLHSPPLHSMAAKAAFTIGYASFVL